MSASGRGAEHQRGDGVLDARVVEVVEPPQHDVGELADLQRAELVVAAEAARAVQRAELQRLARTVIAAGPPRSRATSSAWRSSPPSSPASLDAAPSTPRPTGAPARTSGTTGAIPAPSRALEDGQCATPVPRLAEARDLALGQVHAVREPDVVAEPAELLEVLDRPHAEQLQAERLLLDGLGHVRVQPHAARAGELRRLGHQLARAR